MASVDLRKELECSICLNIYTDPVTLKCGHNFCRDCIGRVWDTQERSGGYSCPECREEFQDRPALHRNITLRNIVENFLSTHPDQEESGVFCTYCIHTPVPAVISCLHCEASLCDNHLRVHSKSPEHVLCDLTTSLENRKCSVHKKILEYYCTEDSTCICVSCRLDGEHRGHQVETLDEASEMKKKKLRNVLQKLMTEREEMEKRVQSLQEHRRKVQGEADDETERVTVLFRDLRRRLEDLEKRVLREISGQAERISGIINDLVQDLEIKKEELSRKMEDIEELCNMTDPLTVLQESDTGDLCDTEDGDDEDRERHDKLLHDGGDLDVGGISHTLHTGLSDIMSGVNVERGVTDILLDVRTAGNYLHISDDMKTASDSSSPQNHPETPERFQDYQVMSSQRFSSGRHYWEVDVGGSGWWRVGMCYPSIERRGDQSRIGWNKKSWCLQRWDNQYSVIHDSNKTPLPSDVSSGRARIDLDYEAGRISFYDLCDPIRHLHTFTTTFTEPLHAGVYVGGGWGGCIKICGGNRKTSMSPKTEEYLSDKLMCGPRFRLTVQLDVENERNEHKVSDEVLVHIADLSKVMAFTDIKGKQIKEIQYTNWTSKTRLHMRKGGLYERHSLKAPMLKEFATYLHETLEMENYKQEECTELVIMSVRYFQFHFSLLLSAMASVDLRKELECYVCLNIYTDPVTLKCGHNFCRDCIGRVLDTQEGSGGYSCPECREEFQDRPALHRNITLRNIVENFLSTHPDREESGVFCTYCIHTPVPAVISCLHCEASLCDNHLRVHSKSPEHVLCDLTTSLENRKCSVHKKILEYYCTEDSTCICVSCRLDGEHRGHQVETLDEASEMKKKKLRNVLQKLMAEREEMEKRVQSLQEHRRKVQGEADDETERVTVLFRDLRRRLEDLEKRVLREISGQAERISGIINDLVQDLEIKKEELSRKMGDIEELCNMTDPLTVLQESDTGDLCDTEDGDDEDRERHDKLLHDGGDLDVGGISHTLHTGLSDIMSGVNVERGVTDILLDVRTAGNYLHISDDRKTASKSLSHQNHPETPERFQDSQVMSSQRFSSGRHYWEVDVGGAEYWRVGMCYPSIDRRGDQSWIGCNKKSWCLEGGRCTQLSVRHDSNKIPLPGDVSSRRVRIDLDYEAGRISFYDLCDPIRHLHTFHTTFTEPLHAGVCVGGVEGGCIKICGGNQK
ncbi:uncharacterized protein [Aquarana catesbeiana]|uniref:uncharacterized protein n=1 Tax=Aquarana catesbeiana TaxID=8400 RepID=UPI003CCA40AE